MVFSFGKKKKEKEVPAQNEKKPDIDYTQIKKELEEKEMKLESAADSERLELLNTLGAGYFKIEDADKAIYFYEMSLAQSRELGKAYTDLMKLYNVKRREATNAKNDEQMKFYMDKIEELMKLSKDMIRGKL